MPEFYLVRPCRSSYVDKRGMRRALKPNMAHGAWIIGPHSRHRLVVDRKYTDIEVPAEQMPTALVARLARHPNTWGIGTYLRAEDLRQLGYPAAEIPVGRFRRWWWFLCNDAGGLA